MMGYYEQVNIINLNELKLYKSMFCNCLPETIKGTVEKKAQQGVSLIDDEISIIFFPLKTVTVKEFLNIFKCNGYQN